MEIVQLDGTCTKTLKYSDLESGEGFTMFKDNTVRFRTDEGHVAFEPRPDETFHCTAYPKNAFMDDPVLRIDSALQWWRP